MLSDFIEKTRSGPFEWGVNDCALWCAAAVDHETGYDPAADLRGTYSSWHGYRRLVVRAGSLEKLIAPRMVHERLTDLDGDGVAIIVLDKRPICGLIVDGRAVVKTMTGLRLEDDCSVIRGWSWSQR